MKLISLRKVILLASIFTLTGCFSTILWNSDKKIRETKEHKIASDYIRAFGKDNTTGQIVMMGDKYWFILDKDSSTEISSVLNSKLPEAFSTKGNNAFKVFVLDSEKVRSIFELHYSPKNAEERKILEDLKFNPLTEKKTLYTKEYGLYGKIYKTSPRMKKNYVFENTLPVEIYHSTYSERINPDFISAIPLAIALDIITLPIQLIIIADDMSK